jgi:hypothetical protein
MKMFNLTVVQNVPPILYLFIAFNNKKNWNKILRTIENGEKSIRSLMIYNLPGTIKAV